MYECMRSRKKSVLERERRERGGEGGRERERERERARERASERASERARERERERDGTGVSRGVIRSKIDCLYPVSGHQPLNSDRKDLLVTY